MNDHPTNRPPGQPHHVSIHRVAWALTGITFLLILSGAAVTTYEAGMVIDDWPTTRGYWLYPITSWLNQGRDFFLGQGHRLLGIPAAILAIGLAVMVWRKEQRLRWLVAGVLAVGLLEGIVGGLRVVGDHDLLMRRAHGWLAPLLLVLCTMLVTLSSRGWHDRSTDKPPPGRLLQWIAAGTAGSLFLMVVLGTLIRHVPLADPLDSQTWDWFRAIGGNWLWSWFQVWVALKLTLATLISCTITWLLIDVWCNYRDRPIIFRRAVLCSVLFTTQLALAVGVWVTNYGWPDWFTEQIWSVSYTVVNEGWWQGILTTLHAAFGALNVAVAVNLAIHLRGPLKKVQ